MENIYEGDAWKIARIAKPKMEKRPTAFGELTKDRVHRAINEKNAAEVGRISDILRRKGMNYGQTWRFFSNITGIKMAEYDDLLYEADNLTEQ